ncbi:MAG: hypothetical protein ACUVWP_08120 [bacterium]
MGLFELFKRNKKKKPRYEIKATLEERPPLEPVIESVQIIFPNGPPEVRDKVLKFLSGLESAFKVRERDVEVIFEIKGDYLEIYRMVGENREIRYQRWGSERAILHCDSREYENLKILGLIKER